MTCNFTKPGGILSDSMIIQYYQTKYVDGNIIKKFLDMLDISLFII